MAGLNSFGARTRLTAGGSTFDIFSLSALERAGHAGVSRLPYSLKILLENLLRCEDGRFVDADDVKTMADWDRYFQIVQAADTVLHKDRKLPDRLGGDGFSGIGHR